MSPASARSLIVGTAGHIDHGKSALVMALTGTDPDGTGGASDEFTSARARGFKGARRSAPLFTDGRGR